MRGSVCGGDRTTTTTTMTRRRAWPATQSINTRLIPLTRILLFSSIIIMGFKSLFIGLDHFIHLLLYYYTVQSEVRGRFPV